MTNGKREFVPHDKVFALHVFKRTLLLKLEITQGYGVTTECGRQRSKVKTLLLQRCALRKFHVTDGQNTCDQITSDRRSKRA